MWPGNPSVHDSADTEKRGAELEARASAERPSPCAYGIGITSS